MRDTPKSMSRKCFAKAGKAYTRDREEAEGQA
jgi:hypothetical protein